MLLCRLIDIYYAVNFKRLYITATRQLKRLESASLSPVYSHFIETVHGVSTIRAFKRQGKFKVECLKRINFYQRGFYSRVMAIRLGFSAAE